jgi:hypothetical protein
MKLLSNLMEHINLSEATKATDICGDSAKITSLARAAVKHLKGEGDKDVSKMPMALVTGQVRSSVDASLLADKVKLGKDALDKVVTCVMKDIQQNAKAYKLVEAEQDTAGENITKMGAVDVLTKAKFLFKGPDKHTGMAKYQNSNLGIAFVDPDTDKITFYKNGGDTGYPYTPTEFSKVIGLTEKQSEDEIFDRIEELKRDIESETVSPKRCAELKSELRALQKRAGQKVSEGANPLEDVKDELEVLKAELADATDAKTRNAIRNQMAQLRTDITKGGRKVAEGYGFGTLDDILGRFPKEYAAFKAGGDLDSGSDFYDALYDFYADEMPYGIQKARDGDPIEWISDRLADEWLN